MKIGIYGKKMDGQVSYKQCFQCVSSLSTQKSLILLLTETSVMCHSFPRGKKKKCQTTMLNPSNNGSLTPDLSCFPEMNPAHSL